MTDAQGLTRVTVNLIPKAAEALDHAAALDRASKTDTINRALQVYDFLTEQAAKGAEICIRTPEDRAKGLITRLKVF